ncbi:MAG: CopD family protein, partial [Acidobacteria bacterium]|nr:CopD family protein [Acidobacteriota bacterium]
AAAGAWITLPLTGHAASFGTSLPHLAQVAHGIAAGLWVGALAAVVAAASPLHREPQGQGRVADLVRRFSPMAIAAVAAITLSGVVTGVFYLGSVGDLWATPYGRALLLKVALFLATGAVGACNWRWLTPRLGEASGTGRLLRSARLELFLAAAVLLVTAVLVHLAMPRETM